MYDKINFPPKTSKITRNVFIIIGIVFIADTVILRFISNWNLGIILPAILGTPLLLYGLFKSKLDVWFKTKAGSFAKWFFITVYLSFVVIFLVGSVVIINGIKTSADEKADAVIVLGGSIRGDKPTYALKNRLDAAADYYRQTPDSLIIVSGGRAEDKKFSEAYVMSKYLIEERNIPRGKIILEDKSKNTAENFEYSKKILDKIFGKDYKSAYVTNDFHIYRAGRIAQKSGLDAFGISAPTPTLITPNCYLRESLSLLKWALLNS